MQARFKSPLLRSLNWAWVLATRCRLRLLSRVDKNILLIPSRPRGCGGSVNEYYHFIFDLAYPLFHVLERTADDVTFYLVDFGPLSRELLRMFPRRVQIVSAGEAERIRARARLVGMNPRGMPRFARRYIDFAKAIRRNIGAQVPPRDRLLVIERVTPEASPGGPAPTSGGSFRRKIVNHADLLARIESDVGSVLKVQNVRLERIPLRDQVETFGAARVVVGQHGAGLANIIWMMPGSTVIELDNAGGTTHFKLVSEGSGLRYHEYRTDALFATVDIDHFSGWFGSLRQQW